MSDELIVNCPHCTVDGVTDGFCHNSPIVDSSSGANRSCDPCIEAARKRKEWEVPDGLWFLLWPGVPRFVTCRVCRGVKKVFLDQETRELHPFEFEE